MTNTQSATTSTEAVAVFGDAGTLQAAIAVAIGAGGVFRLSSKPGNHSKTLPSFGD